MAPKGVSNRTLLAKKKGIKMGQTILVTYREDGRGSGKTYEGVLCDRRIGGTDRESYLELKKCLLVNNNNEVVSQEGNKRFVDAFIDDIDVTEARPDPPDPAIAAAEAAAAAAAAAAEAPNPGMGMMPCMGMMGGMMPGMNMGMNPMGMSMGMNPMGCPTPGSMPAMGGMGAMGGGMPGMSGMGMPGMGMGGMGNMGGMGGMPGMGGCGMGGCPMGGCGMGMGMMGMMNPMMNPMAAMGMGMAMRANAMRAMQGSKSGDGESTEASSAQQLVFSTGPEMEDVNAKIEALEIGKKVHIEYTHPQLGRTKYQGTLKEKFEGESHLQSYVELTDSRRIGKRGQQREVEATKRLMVAFIDDVKDMPAEAVAAREKSRSPRRSPAKT